MCGGTLASLAADDVQVTLVCATRGEVGEISDPALATPVTLPQVREGELRCAARELGIGEPIFLGFRDSGMAGTPENQHPAAFINATDDEVVGKLVSVIRDARPQVVVTFDESGAYGHPDHVAIWRHTHAAVEAASDGACYAECGHPWQVERIAYAVMPRSMFAQMRAKLAENGEDTSDLDAFIQRGIGFPDEQIDAVVDVSTFVERKFAAIKCHRTQFAGDNFFSRVGEDEMRRMMSREFFSFGWPAAERGPLGDALFP